MRFYMINGTLVPSPEARLHVTDLGLVRGYALFDFFRVQQGVPLFLDDYLDRLFRSAGLLGIALPASREDLKSHVFSLLEANGARETGVKVVATGGTSEDGFTPSAPNLILMQQDLKPHDPKPFKQASS